MKILNIILYIVLVVLIVFAALDITSQAGFSETDRKAVALAAKQMDKQLEELSFTKVRKYNYLMKQIEACKNQEGFDSLRNKLQLARKLSFENIKNAAWLQSALQEKGGSVTLPDSSLNRIEGNFRGLAQSLSTLTTNNKSFAPPIPYQSEVLGKEVHLADLQNSDAIFWDLSQGMVSTFCFEMEDELLNQFIRKIECEENKTPDVTIAFASHSGVVSPDENYVANMMLSGNYFTTGIEVTSPDGEVSYSNDKQSATLRIAAKADDFDEDGNAVKMWTATLKVPAIDGYRTFNLEREFTITRSN